MIIQRLRKSISFTIFITVLATCAYFYQGGGQNESARFDTIRAFLDEGHFVVDKYVYNSADVIKFNGHYYSSKAPGTFYLGVLPFALTNNLLKVFGVEENQRFHWVCYVTTLCTTNLAVALLAVLIYWMGLRLNCSRSESAAIALILSLGTIAFPFATLFFSHVITAAALFFGFYAVFAFAQDKRDENWRLWMAGFSLGFAITLEYPAAIGAVIVGLYALHVFFHRLDRKKFWKYAGWFVGAGVIGLIPLFIYNLAAFGNAFYVTYEAYAQAANTDFQAHKKGILGIRIPFLDPEAWPLFSANLAEITVKPLRGLFFANPVLLLIFPGVLLLARRKWRIRFPWPLEIVLAVVIFLAYLFMNAGFGDSIVYWGGGASFGPRHVITALPFLAILLFAALRLSWQRLLIMPLGFYSLFTCLMATAIEPRTPYAPANPIFQFYLPQFLNARFAVNKSGTFSNDLITWDSVAFNFGKLAHLPAAFSLLPLFAFWLLCAWHLDRQMESPKGRGFLFAILAFVLIVGWLPIAASA